MIILDILRIILSVLFILFLPGFVWSYVFFKNKADWIERITISCGLSIAIVTLVVLWLNWIFHVHITLLNTSLIVCALIVVPVSYLLIRNPALREDVLSRTRNLRDRDAKLYYSRLQNYLHLLVISPKFKIVLYNLERITNFILKIGPLWVFTATLIVYLSYLLQWGAFLPWIGLAIAFLPFPLQWVYQGSLRLHTSFDIPIALFTVGAVVGLIVSPKFSLSLGAFQCILATSLFYYSWVNYPHLATLMKWLISLAVFSALVWIIFAAVEWNMDPISSGQLKSTYHGLALFLIILATIFTGMAIFSRSKIARVVGGFVCLFIFVGLILLIQDSLPRLISGESVDIRLPRWETTIGMIGDSPIVGLGLGCWAFTYHGTELISHPTHVHNAYLELYSNTGFLGALALLIALIIGLKLAWDIVKSSRSHSWYGFGIGVLTACFITIIVGVVESAPVGVAIVSGNTYNYAVSPAPWILAGLVISAHRLLSKKEI
ncbi:O-antigen ligase family protein [Chloroflexota bacterium]